MADERDIWIRNIRAVEREYVAARFSFHRSIEQARQDPSILPGGLRIREMDLAAARLEGTYIIRLFAEFETALRIFIRKARRRTPPSRTRDLLESVAAIMRIPPDELRNAHAVREYRNVLIHEREAGADPLTITAVRGRLCLYLSFLPRHW
jgi:hypothetical protein